jgi:hypothetical protein
MYRYSISKPENNNDGVKVKDFNANDIIKNMHWPLFSFSQENIMYVYIWNDGDLTTCKKWVLIAKISGQLQST